MRELTIIIDNVGHKELKGYLMSLTGVSDVIIENEIHLQIYVKYDPNLITPKIIKMEILLFLDIKTSSILAFDKNPIVKTSKYKIVKDTICCEYCLKGAIETLFEIEGIEKAESNVNFKNANKQNGIIIYIEYNSELINLDTMKQIESSLNI